MSKNWSENALVINPSHVTDEISAFILDRFQELNRKVAIIGLSGGLDSSLTAALTVRSLGKDRVQLYYLPEADSKPLHRQHASLLADHLGIKLKTIKITSILRALQVYRLLPLRFLPGYNLKAQAVNFGRSRFLSPNDKVLLKRLQTSGNSWVARANAYINVKHRVRSIVLFHFADKLQGLVVGAANRTEWMTGTFTLWGCDHCADIMPILHLYRSQLIPLAEYLGLPGVIIQKPADPDVLPGLDDKGSLLGSFNKVDHILWCLENQIPLNQIEAQFGQEEVSYIKTLVNISSRYRETPYSLL
jgi:NAD+ synthase